VLTKIQKSENSDDIYLTKNMLLAAQINVGDEVQVTIQNGRIIVETVAQARRRTDLQALLTKMPEDYQPEEIDWGKPVSKEEW
jgi:antitoxin MazE